MKYKTTWSSQMMERLSIILEKTFNSVSSRGTHVSTQKSTVTSPSRANISLAGEKSNTLPPRTETRQGLSGPARTIKVITRNKWCLYTGKETVKWTVSQWHDLIYRKC